VLLLSPFSAAQKQQQVVVVYKQGTPEAVPVIVLLFCPW
jgi:hypothetical protein